MLLGRESATIRETEPGSVVCDVETGAVRTLGGACGGFSWRLETIGVPGVYLPLSTVGSRHCGSWAGEAALAVPRPVASSTVRSFLATQLSRRYAKTYFAPMSRIE